MSDNKRAFEFREKVRDEHITRIVGSGLATRAEYDEPAIMQAYSDAETAQLRSQLSECQREREEARKAVEIFTESAGLNRRMLTESQQQLQQMKEAVKLIHGRKHNIPWNMVSDSVVEEYVAEVRELAALRSKEEGQ